MKTITYFFVAILLLLGVPDTHAQDYAKLYDPKFVAPVGKTTEQFIEWAKSIEIWNPNDMYMASPGQDVFTFYTKPIQGWQTKYQYIFKNDSCQRMVISPASIDGWQKQISRDYQFVEKKEVNGKTYHIYHYKNGGHKIAFEERADRSGKEFERKVLVYPL